MPTTYKQPPRLASEDKLILEKLGQGYSLTRHHRRFIRRVEYVLNLSAGPLAISANRIHKLMRRGLLASEGGRIVLAERRP